MGGERRDGERMMAYILLMIISLNIMTCIVMLSPPTRAEYADKVGTMMAPPAIIQDPTPPSTPPWNRNAGKRQRLAVSWRRRERGPLKAPINFILHLQFALWGEEEICDPHGFPKNETTDLGLQGPATTAHATICVFCTPSLLAEAWCHGEGVPQRAPSCVR